MSTRGRTLPARGKSESQRGLVTSDNLPPHKARILPRLALTKTIEPKQINGSSTNIEKHR
jgi:L-asparaginase/Glu-tRNA(Gln) amidotransferase subunit D